MASYRIGFLAFLLAVIICGCSGTNSPSSPTLPDEVESTPGTTADAQSMTSQAGNHYLWAYHFVYVNPEENEFEIVPIRQTSIHWNVLSWLENGPCTNCLKITGISPSGYGTVLIDIEISHPFDNFNLTGFDVRGIAMFNASHMFPESGLTFSDRTLGDGAVINIDGYTTLYNPTTIGAGPGGMEGYFKGKWATIPAPNALLNAYKRFVSDDPDNTRNAFYAGDAITVTYEIKMPDDEFIFGYAVDASWATPINKPVDDPITDFGPDANCPEAWKIDIQDLGPGLTAQGGTTKLQIDVYDSQGKDDAHPVLVECPELFNGEVKATFVSDGDGYTRYEAEIENVKLASTGYYPCLVSKEAQENDPSGKPWLDLTAYQVFPVEVGWPDGYPINVTPPWLNLSPYDICMEGNYAYIAGGINGLHIFDISDPENPVWINRVDTNWSAAKVVVSGSCAVVASNYSGQPDHSKLDIVDIDPPESAHIINTIDFFGYVRGLAVSGSSVCYIRRVQGGPDLYIIDIDPPESAQVVKYFGLPWSSSGDVAASDGYACVPIHTGLWVIDIDPPESAYIVKELDSDINGEIAISDGYAYAEDWSSIIQIIDIDPPDLAYIVNSIDTPDDAEDIAVAGGYAYAVSQFQLDIFDVYPPESAYQVNSINLAGENTNSIATSGGYAYVGDRVTGLQVIDIDPPESAYSANVIDTLSDAHGVALSDGYAYVADDYGLQIIDFEPLESAYIVKSIHTPGGAQEVAVTEAYAYVADGESGLQIIDIDPLESAFIVNTVDTPGHALEVVALGAYAYIADGESGLQIIDIDPPQSAYIVNTVDTPDAAYGVALSGDYAYVADGESGLQIIDIEPPESAYILNTVDTPGSARGGVTVSGDYAYVALYYAYNSGLQIVDINPPESAHIAKSFSTGWTRGVAVSGGYAYVGADPGLQIIDIDPPESAYIVNSFDMPGSARGVAVSDNYACVAGYDFGIRIIKLW